MARPREFDETAVLAAAREVFWTKGYAAASVDAIGVATGLGKGSLYGAFGGKRGLFGQVFDQYCTNALRATAAALAGPDREALERLRAFVSAGAAATGGDARRGCLLAKSVAELADHDADVQQRANETYMLMEDYLTAAVEAAQRHGSLRPDGDAHALAQTLLALQRGLEALGKAGTPVPGSTVLDVVLASFR